jgi:hypothetical protein
VGFGRATRRALSASVFLGSAAVDHSFSLNLYECVEKIRENSPFGKKSGKMFQLLFKFNNTTAGDTVKSAFSFLG